MRVLILESCLCTHKFWCLTRVCNKDHSCFAKINYNHFICCCHRPPPLMPQSSSAPFFSSTCSMIYCHLIHLLHATCLPVEKVAFVPGDIYFRKMILGAMTVRFQFTVPVVYPPTLLVSLSTLACDAIRATTKILWQC